MATRTVAGLLVETLARAGVERIYGVQATHSTESRTRFADTSGMRWVHVRHEEAAAFAAARRLILPGGWRSVPEAAAPGISI